MINYSMPFIKHLLLFIALCISNNIISQSIIKVFVDAPKTAKIEKEFMVTVAIQKQQEGTGKLIYKLPKGFEAYPKDIGKAIFKFEDNTIRLFWVKLPSQNTFIASFMVKITNDAKIGYQAINGHFLFNSHIKREKINLTPFYIEVIR